MHLIFILKVFQLLNPDSPIPLIWVMKPFFSVQQDGRQTFTGYHVTVDVLICLLACVCACLRLCESCALFYFNFFFLFLNLSSFCR